MADVILPPGAAPVSSAAAPRIEESDFSFRKMKIATVCLVGGTFATSLLPFGALTLLMTPMTREFGWSRTEFSYAMTFLMWSGALSVMIFGRLSDTLGVRPVILVGTVLVALITLACAFQDGSLWQFYALFGLFGVIGCSRIAYQKVIGALFTRHRGKGLALFGVESTIAAAAVPPLTNVLLASYGWRGMFVGFAVVILALVPVLYFTLEEPGRAGSLPGARRKGKAAAAAPPAPVLTGMTVREVAHDRVFWLITIASVFAMAPAAGMLTHMVAAITDKGFSRSTAVWILSLTTLCSPFGVAAGGFLLDRFQTAKVKVPFQATLAAGTACLAAATAGFGGVPLLVASAVLKGFSQGAATPMATYFHTRFFGLKSFTTVYSVQHMAQNIALGLSAPVIGLIFDRTGSYAGAFALIIGSTLFAGLVFFFLGPYRYPVDPTQERTR